MFFYFRHFVRVDVFLSSKFCPSERFFNSTFCPIRRFFFRRLVPRWFLQSAFFLSAFSPSMIFTVGVFYFDVLSVNQFFSIHQLIRHYSRYKNVFFHDHYLWGAQHQRYLYITKEKFEIYSVQSTYSTSIHSVLLTHWFNISRWWTFVVDQNEAKLDPVPGPHGQSETALK